MPHENESSYYQKLALICVLYLIIEAFFSHFIKLSIDDFWLAFHTYQYKTQLPYRDFSPYKTVLGYYLFLPPLSLLHGVLSPLLITKFYIALINTLFLFGVSMWLKKFYSTKAILSSLILIIFTQLFIYFSIDIRVDFLAYWLCLISVLCVFDNRYRLAGISMGVGFIICQKAIIYFIATNCAMFGYLLSQYGLNNTIRPMLRYNIYAGLILAIYILFWSYVSNFHDVIKSIFYEPYFIASIDWYADMKGMMWRELILNNLGIVLLWPFALFGLFILPKSKRYPFILIYTFVLLCFIVTCKQPFDYVLLTAFPALMLLYIEFFSSLYATCSFFQILRQHQNAILIFSLGYMTSLFVLFCFITLPSLYFVVTLIPWILCFYVLSNAQNDTKNILKKVSLFTVICVGLIFPSFDFIGQFSEMDGRYQKSMMNILNELLDKEEGYIAGVPLLLDKKEPVPGLVHLVGPAIGYLHHPSQELKPILSLTSLYLSPATTEEIIASIKQTPVKLYVDNNRFHFIPAAIHQYLATEFQHFWGSIFLYAPQVEAGRRTIQIKFSGKYQVKAPIAIKLDHQKITPNSLVYFTKGQHLSEANTTYRLRLTPDHLDTMLEPEFKANHWQKLLK